MKLQEKFNRGLLKILAIVILPVALISYLFFDYAMREEIDEQLTLMADQIAEILEQGQIPTDVFPLHEVSEVTKFVQPYFSDTSIVIPTEDDEPLRQYTTCLKLGGTIYQVIVRKVAVESGDLFLLFVGAAIGIICLLGGLLFWWTTKINHQLWHPFHHQLSAISKYSVKERKLAPLEPTEIEEFATLGKVLVELTAKIDRDYQNLKAFSENASHELQTPLAIIRSQIENLINKPGLKKEDAKNLRNIYSATNRLSKTNQSLMLLSRIDNNQFSHAENVNIVELINAQKSWLIDSAIIDVQHLKIDGAASLMTNINPFLAEVLVRNMIENMIRHGSECKISVSDRVVTFSNGGSTALANREKIFDRFHKASDDDRSSGLGLAIVKSICDLYDYKVEYFFEEYFHHFKITFCESNT